MAAGRTVPGIASTVSPMHVVNGGRTYVCALFEGDEGQSQYVV